MDQVEAALEAPENDAFVCRADTVAELAEHFGMDSDALEATVARYNELCHGVEDLDIGKDAQFMVALENGPLCMACIRFMFVAIDGGIPTTCVQRRLTMTCEPFLACTLSAWTAR